MPRLEAASQVDVTDVDDQLLVRLQIALAELLQVLGQALHDIGIGPALVSGAVEAGIAKFPGAVKMHLDLRGRGALCHAVQ
ncbi:hypothetical protein D3C79_965550 [compost metagenome]